MFSSGPRTLDGEGKEARKEGPPDGRRKEGRSRGARAIFKLAGSRARVDGVEKRDRRYLIDGAAIQQNARLAPHCSQPPEPRFFLVTCVLQTIVVKMVPYFLRYCDK